MEESFKKNRATAAILITLGFVLGSLSGAVPAMLLSRVTVGSVPADLFGVGISTGAMAGVLLVIFIFKLFRRKYKFEYIEIVFIPWCVWFIIIFVSGPLNFYRWIGMVVQIVVISWVSALLLVRKKDISDM